ncbi:hypothetical protein [Desulfuromonas thiophila]|uniref:hypothetical protein n=1 Tax=Desulfuromonas thiophila TaxID=57664 RepID=UPI0024A9D3FB|nr:hypothetical protein [Desulfuromonas thiophila]
MSTYALVKSVCGGSVLLSKIEKGDFPTIESSCSIDLTSLLIALSSGSYPPTRDMVVSVPHHLNLCYRQDLNNGKTFEFILKIIKKLEEIVTKLNNKGSNEIENLSGPVDKEVNQKFDKVVKAFTNLIEKLKKNKIDKNELKKALQDIGTKFSESSLGKSALAIERM